MREKLVKVKNNNLEIELSKNSTKGITLISLVITIILLIILAGIIISLSIGENGVFKKAKQAKEKTNLEVAREKIELKIVNAQLEIYEKEERMPTLKELSLILNNDDEIEYVTETTQVAIKKYEVGEEPKLIYTKLKEYPYEFEINPLLKIGNIDETKIENEKNKGTLKRVILGNYSSQSTQTYDVSSYPGYKNFTEENFACSPITSIGFGGATITSYGTIVYDSDTGIVTFPYAARDIYNGASARCYAYLYYIDYTE